MLELNKLYNMDCVKGMRLLDDECIDLTVTSPPYDNLRDYKGYHFDATDVIKQLYRVTKKGGVVVWVVGDATVNGSETGNSFRQALYFKDIGFNLHDTMIYKKTSYLHQNCKRYQQEFEYMFIFSKGDIKTFNGLRDRKKYIDKRKPSQRINDETNNRSGIQKELKIDKPRGNVWSYAIGGGHVTIDKIAYQHPAIFPEKLAADHIYSWSNEGDIVLDPFAGSGTTLKMAIEYKRNYIGFEISEEYCELASKRIENHKLQLKLF